MGDIQEAKDFLMDKHSIKLVRTNYYFTIYLKTHNSKVKQSKKFLKGFVKLTDINSIVNSKYFVESLNYLEMCNITYLKMYCPDNDAIRSVIDKAKSLFDLIGEKYDDC